MRFHWWAHKACVKWSPDVLDSFVPGETWLTLTWLVAARCTPRQHKLIMLYLLEFALYLWHVSIMASHIISKTLWHHPMETFSALLALCEGNPPVTSEFPSQMPLTWSFDVFFDLHLNKQLSKQSRCQWFEMPSHSLSCHCNDISHFIRLSRLN